jgi:hypothetical protein
MRQDEAERARRRLAAAESNLKELSELLDRSLLVGQDICKRTRQGDSSADLKSKASRFMRIISRMLDVYFPALDEFLSAASQASDFELERGPNGPMRPSDE